MKSFILWSVAIVFLFLGATAVKQHEWLIALFMVAVALGCVWAAPAGSKKNVDIY